MSKPEPMPESTVELLRKASKAGATAATPLRRAWIDNRSVLSAMLPAMLEAQARAALEKDGDVLGAHDLAIQGVELAELCGYPTGDLRLLQATALARSGSPIKARAVLEQCVAGESTSPLIYGALARTYRDIAREEPDNAIRQRLFLHAADWAERGIGDALESHQPGPLLDRAYLLGQVAQFSRLGGDLARSTRAIEVVLETCAAAEAAGAYGDQRFWIETNRAEMALLLDDPEKAAAHYRAMVALAPDQLSSITANAGVCRMLLAALGHSAGCLDNCFPLPQVVVFSGHMFDTPGRTVTRFPPANANAIKGAIARWLEPRHAIHGYASASGGSDILFAEAVLERGGSLRLVLPFSAADTRKHCVESHGGEWVRRFDAIVAAAEDIAVVVSGDVVDLADSPAHYRYTNHQLLGTARLRASRMGLALRSLVVWDATDAIDPLPGGTGDFFSLAHSLGVVPDIISPSNGRAIAPPMKTSRPKPLREDLATNRCIRTFLFADVKGFSAIPDSLLRDFATRFLQTAADILHADDSGVILCNTWGDALYAVFDSAEKAAFTALRLRDKARLEVCAGELRLRISLHAGPVYVSHDPVIRNEAYIGSNVVRAARMEPISEAGQVLVSDELAALLATSPEHHRYAFHYRGLARLPKEYGRMPVYELEHARPVALQRKKPRKFGEARMRLRT